MGIPDILSIPDALDARDYPTYPGHPGHLILRMIVASWSLLSIQGIRPGIDPYCGRVPN